MEPILVPAGKRTVRIYRAAEAKPAVVMCCGEAEAAEIAAITGEACTLIAVDGIDWNRDLSPWRAKRVFRGEADFAGGADDTLRELAGRIIPVAERAMGFAPRRKMIAGYSMAGLFAVYALYRCSDFCAAASVSGSLWYDGFAEFAEQNRPERIPDKIYFSVGDREHLTRNPRMAIVEECIAQIAARFRGLGADTVFERNPGNHFADVAARTAKGILAICGAAKAHHGDGAEREL